MILDSPAQFRVWCYLFYPHGVFSICLLMKNSICPTCCVLISSNNFTVDWHGFSKKKAVFSTSKNSYYLLLSRTILSYFLLFHPLLKGWVGTFYFLILSKWVRTLCRVSFIHSQEAGFVLISKLLSIFFNVSGSLLTVSFFS